MINTKTLRNKKKIKKGNLLAWWKTVFPSFVVPSPQVPKTTAGLEEEPTHRHSWRSMQSEVRPEHGAGRRGRLRGTDPEPRRRSSGLLLSLHPLHPQACAENKQGHDLRKNHHHCTTNVNVPPFWKFFNPSAIFKCYRSPILSINSISAVHPQTPVEHRLKIGQPKNVFLTACCNNI